jgi:hypothetical protein
MLVGVPDKGLVVADVSAVNPFTDSFLQQAHTVHAGASAQDAAASAQDAAASAQDAAASAQDAAASAQDAAASAQDAAASAQDAAASHKYRGAGQVVGGSFAPLSMNSKNSPTDAWDSRQCSFCAPWPTPMPFLATAGSDGTTSSFLTAAPHVKRRIGKRERVRV